MISGVFTLCILTVGLGEIRGGVEFDLMERDLFGGNAGGRLELLMTSFIDGVVVMEMLFRKKKNVYLFGNSSRNKINIGRLLLPRTVVQTCHCVGHKGTRLRCCQRHFVLLPFCLH